MIAAALTFAATPGALVLLAAILATTALLIHETTRSTR